MSVQPLLLAGGRSSRMGSRKELLCITDSFPIFYTQLLRLHLAFPNSTVFLSLPSPRSLTEITGSPRVERLTQTTLRLRHQSTSFLVKVIYDHSDEPLGSAEPEGNQGEIGPAAGLLSAHRRSPDATWLVVACDYPFFGVPAMHHLRDSYESVTKSGSGSEIISVTCFENHDGIYEPLLGIWPPGSLALLQENVNKGILGPKQIVLKTKGQTIRPLNQDWLFNMNTHTEYEQALGMTQEIELIVTDTDIN